MKPYDKLLLISIFVFLSLGSLNSKSKKKKPKVENVYSFSKEMNEEEYNQYSLQNKVHYLLFYEPWSSLSKNVLSLFDSASLRAMNRGWDVDFITINSANNKNITKAWEISTFPTIYWLNMAEGEKLLYDGAKSMNALMKYMNSALNFTAEELQDYETLENMKKAGRYFIFVGDNEKHWDDFRKLVRFARDDDIEFIYWTKSEYFFTKFAIEPESFDVVMYHVKNKTLHNGHRLYLSGNTTRPEVERILEIYSRKAWGRMDEFMLLSAVEHLSPTPTMFVFYDKNQSDFRELGNTIQKLAEKYRKELWILNCTMESPHNFVLRDVFNFERKHLPVVMLVQDNYYNLDDVDKYLMPLGTPVTAENVENFYSDFKNGKLNKFIFSEEVPKEQDDENGIIRVVGTTYNELVLNNLDKNILLFLCINESKRCMGARERFVRLTDKLKNNKDLVFAEIDTALNEFTHVFYDKLPAVALFLRSNSTNPNDREVKVYDGDFLTNSIFYWILSTVKIPIEKVETLDSESTIFRQESRSPIKTSTKDKVESIINLEERYKTGLRRAVNYEMDLEHKIEGDKRRKIEKELKVKPKSKKSTRNKKEDL